MMNLSHLPVNSWPFSGDMGAKAKKTCDVASVVRRIDKRATSITVDGIRFPSLCDAARHFSVPIATVRARICRGWKHEEAVSVPTRKAPKQ